MTAISMRPRKTLTSDEVRLLGEFLSKKHTEGTLKPLVKQGGLKAFSQLTHEEISYQRYYAQWLTSEGVRAFAHFRGSRKFMEDKVTVKISRQCHEKLMARAKTEGSTIEELLMRLLD